jgi:hypothetical protein
MFGYVIPYRKTLSETAQEEYRADYCGLCRCLGKRYGFPARFLVSYDGAFLCALLLAQEDTAPAPRCFCPAHPFCRKRCAVQNAPMEFAADVSVLLMCWKLRDTVADGGFFSRKAAHMALLLLRPDGTPRNRISAGIQRIVCRAAGKAPAAGGGEFPEHRPHGRHLWYAAQRLRCKLL